MVGGLADADLTAIVSYLRTLEPVRAAVLGQALFAFGMFRPAFKGIPPYVATGPSVERGAYLDPTDDFAFVAPELSGGGPHPSESAPGLEYVPPNLTPDPATGVMAGWTEDQFVARFRAGRGFPDTIMRWESYGQLTDADLRSIFRFLRALPPVRRETGPSLRPAGWTPEG